MRLIPLVIFDPTHPTESFIFVFVGVVVAALGLSLLVKRWRNQRDVLANTVLAIVVLGFVLIIDLVNLNFRWQLIVAMLPAILVAYQAFFLWLYQPKEVKRQQSTPSWEDEILDDYRQRAVDILSSHFGVRTLFIRYVFPAVLLGVAGIVILSVAIDPRPFVNLIMVIREKGLVPLSGVATDANATKMILGIKLGAIGAYTYVLLELGQRTFRHDITGASAMWCLVTLVLGPVLAASVATLWQINGPSQDQWWGGGVVLFFTGFAPRRVMAAIEQAAAQLLKIGGPGVVVQSRWFR